MDQPSRVPPRAWVVTFAGTAVNLCLGILYAWSVWKAALIAGKGHELYQEVDGVQYPFDDTATARAALEARA